MKKELYVIECRTNGRLDFTGKQPENFFGTAATTGINSDQMAKIIFNRIPSATLDGRSVCSWPQQIDSRFIARPKTW